MKPVPQIRVRHFRGASLGDLEEQFTGGRAEELLCTEIVSSGKTAPAEIRATYQVDAKTDEGEDGHLFHLLRTCAKTIRPVLERNRSTPGCDIHLPDNDYIGHSDEMLFGFEVGFEVRGKQPILHPS